MNLDTHSPATMGGSFPRRAFAPASGATALEPTLRPLSAQELDVLLDVAEREARAGNELPELPMLVGYLGSTDPVWTAARKERLAGVLRRLDGKGAVAIFLRVARDATSALLEDARHTLAPIAGRLTQILRSLVPAERADGALRELQQHVEVRSLALELLASSAARPEIERALTRAIQDRSEAVRSLAASLLVKHLRQLCADGRRQRAVELILLALDGQLRASRLREVDALLSLLPVDALEPSVLLAALSATQPVAPSLNERAAFCREVERSLVARLGADRTERLLQHRR